MLITPREMQGLLRDTGYFANRSLAIAAALFATRLEREEGLKAILLDGPPGTGKSFFAKCFAQAIGAELAPTFQFDSSTMKHDLFMMEDIPSITRASVLREVDDDGDIWEQNLLIPRVIPNAIQASHDRKIVVLLDEIDKARPDVDSFFLHLLQTGQLIVHLKDYETKERLDTLEANPENIWFVVTKNDERSLSEPLMRRLQVVQMDWPSAKVETTIASQRIPEAPSGLIEFVVGLAGRIRETPGVRKPPATQEVTTAIAQLIHFSAPENSFSWGFIVRSNLVKFEHDRKIMDEIASESAISKGVRPFMKSLHAAYQSTATHIPDVQRTNWENEV